MLAWVGYALLKADPAQYLIAAGEELDHLFIDNLSTDRALFLPTGAAQETGSSGA